MEADTQVKVPERKPRWQEIAEGLHIMAKYGDVPVAAEHDEFFAGPEPDAMSHEDCVALEALHWHKSEYGGWAKFV